VNLVKKCLAAFVLIWFSAGDLIAQYDTLGCVANETFTIVILGSSTAAGAGPSTADSAWVNQYRAYVQSINPGNQVINLAQGGYTTYHIMPSEFVPPAGRPNPDTNRNITRALTHNPDAIIVNMPSNDSANGFGVPEQLSNFDSLYRKANSNDIHIWICTTQPKTALSNAWDSVQVSVKDSILARYGFYSIDFWNEIALPDNTIDPLYDADGTHLNDAGHRILFNRVRKKQILASIYPEPEFTDFAVSQIQLTSNQICGSDSVLVQTFIQSPGLGDSSAYQVQLKTFHNDSGAADSVLLSGTLNTHCQSDTLLHYLNLQLGGSYTITASLSHAQDQNPSNDILVQVIDLNTPPMLQTVSDSACLPESIELIAIAESTDSIQWFASEWSPNPIATGSTYTTPMLDAPTDFFVQAGRKEREVSDSLATVFNGTTHWNGVMVDIHAIDKDLILEKIQLPLYDTGFQKVELYSKAGSHIGFETVPAAWTFIGLDSFQVDSLDQRIWFNLNDWVLGLGDTLAFYFQLQNSAARLTYSGASQAATVSDEHLSIFPASGANHQFGGLYHPRRVNTQIQYRFTEDIYGQCLSPRIPVHAFIDTLQLDLGPDIMNLDTNTIEINLPAGFHAPEWNTGSTESTLVLYPATDLNLGWNTIWVHALTMNDCPRSDTLQIWIDQAVKTQNPESPLSLQLSPNPATDQICIEGLPTHGSSRVYLFDESGKQVQSWKVRSDKSCFQLNNYPSGLYRLVVYSDKKSQTLQFIKK
jgi:lysophospholipase L1-like esterase